MRAFFYSAFIFERHSIHSAPRGRMNRMLRMHSVPTILIPDLRIKKRALSFRTKAKEIYVLFSGRASCIYSGFFFLNKEKILLL